MPCPMPSNTDNAPDPRLARSLWQALCTGLLLLACLPGARGQSPIGPLPLWLLLSPVVGLLAAYRQRLGLALRRLLAAPSLPRISAH